MRAVFRAADLVLCTEPHYAWACYCGAERLLGEESALATAGRAPVCECGEYMAPVNPDRRPS